MKAQCALRQKEWRKNRLPAAEIAVIRNQMYRLLTPEQQAVLNEKHEQRMEQLRDVAHWKKAHR